MKVFVYSQSTGKLFNEGGLCIASDCYSGYGPGKNKPAMQHVEGIGPIPEGLWYMTSVEDSPETGRDTIILQAAPDTNTYGRGGSTFRIHGDGIGNPGKASRGCIIARYDVRRVLIASIEGKPEDALSRKLWVDP
jgi:hypothetical protein